MSKTVINSLEVWGQSKTTRLPSAARWKSRRSASPTPARPKADEAAAAEDTKAVMVIWPVGFKVRRLPVYREIDWLTDEQRPYLERTTISSAAGSTGKATHTPVAACKLLEYDDTDAVCEMLVSGYEVPRVSLPKWVLDAKGVKVGDRFHWIMRDATYISLDDIDTEVGTSQLQLTDAERNHLMQLHAEVVRERELDGEEWEEYIGPGQ